MGRVGKRGEGHRTGVSEVNHSPFSSWFIFVVVVVV